MAVSRDGVKTGAGDSAGSGAERDVIDRYRKASGELDERPSAATRASILAAAAREVGAKPVDAATPYRAGRRWPLAAAAAVMLSTLAVMMAIRTNEEMPQFSDASAPARSAADNATPPAATAPAAATAQSPSATPAAPAAPPSMAEKSISSKPETKNAEAVERSSTRAQENFGGRLKKESDSVAQAPREESRPIVREAPAAAPASELDRMRQNAPVATVPPPPPTEPTGRPKLRAEQGAAAGAAAPTAPTDQASGDARRDVAKAAESPPLAAAQSERKQADESAAVWLERIIKLRREGRHEEADAELKRFRERYPQVQPPAEALPPTGAR
jgi:hypothetical protein